MLYGRYQHNVDAKGRLFVPAKLREKLGESFIAAVVLDRCICLYSTDEWDAMLDQIAALPMTKGRVLMRQLTSNAEDVTPDAQGRILLPRHLLEYAGIEKAALVIGAGKRAEIWNPETYDAEMETLSPENMEEEFANLGF